MTKSFDLFEPCRQRTPVIFAFPHSGRAYPRALAQMSELSACALRSSEDWRVDHLFASVLREGAICLRARMPRAWVDLNRDSSELDPRLIKGMAPRRLAGRVNSGLGVVPRVVGGGQAIYPGKLSRAQVEARLQNVWHPYHDTLAQVMQQTVAKFGQAILLDCHSMPPEALDRVTPPRPEIILGDLFGRAASAYISNRVAQAFGEEGFKVVRNVPFAGAFIAEKYGRPAENLHCVQIEIDRGLYQLADAPYTPGAPLRDLRLRLAPVIGKLAQIGCSRSAELAAQ